MSVYAVGLYSTSQAYIEFFKPPVDKEQCE